MVHIVLYPIMTTEVLQSLVKQSEITDAFLALSLHSEFSVNGGGHMSFGFLCSRSRSRSKSPDMTFFFSYTIEWI